MALIVAQNLPGGFRSDAGTDPGIGRDGRAITAAIVPESIGQKLTDLAGTALDLYRARLARKANPSARRARRRGVQDTPTDVTDAAASPLRALRAAQSGGGLLVIGLIAIAVLLWRR